MESDKDAMRASSALNRMRELQDLYSGLGTETGMSSFSMTSAWCGWLSFGFSGVVAISDEEGSLDAGITVCEGETPVAVSCSTAYCSSVLLDLCMDLMRILQEEAPNSPDLSVTVFCDAEEHGEYAVTIGHRKVTIRETLADDGDLCSVTRADGGSYLRDLTECLCDLHGKICNLPGDEREGVLGSLCLFCEMVTEDEDGQIGVTDAENEDVARMFEDLAAACAGRTAF